MGMALLFYLVDRVPRVLNIIAFKVSMVRLPWFKVRTRGLIDDSKCTWAMYGASISL